MPSKILKVRGVLQIHKVYNSLLGPTVVSWTRLLTLQARFLHSFGVQHRTLYVTVAEFLFYFVSNNTQIDMVVGGTSER